MNKEKIWAQLCEAREEVGKLAEKADNFYSAGHLPIPPPIQAELQQAAMKEIRNNLRDLYTNLTGESPWSTK